MVLVAQGTKEEEEIFDCLVQKIIIWQAFLLLLWSFFTCCCKGCDFFQTLINGWLKGSLKQIDFEPSKLKQNILSFFQKLKTYFHLHKVQKLCLVPQTLNPQNVPITMKTLENTQNMYCLL